MQPVGFPRDVADAYQAVLAAAADAEPWALFSYDRNFADLHVAATGQGLDDLADEWDDNLVQYAFARVVEPTSRLPKFVFVSWCGEGVPVAKKGGYNYHLSDVVRFFKGFHVHISARSDVDVTKAAILRKVEDSAGAKYAAREELPA
ncbi:hypothetical protein HK405_010238, partial [Cladochytrium tenue]